MQQYLRRNRLSGLMDAAGAVALSYGAAVLWFAWLWGLGVPALLAGAALGTLLWMARCRWRACRVARREEALRRRIGAELLLEELLLSGAQTAHRQAAKLIARRWPIIVDEVAEEGAVCRQGSERLLVMCLRAPEDSDLSAGDLVAAQRAVRAAGAERGVICTLGKASPKSLARAEQAALPLRIISRETLLNLAAAVAPATDEQLVALGKRRRRPAGQGSVLQLVFRRDKARRYFGYGLAMTLLYVATGVRVYAVPGMVCLTMAVFSRMGRSEERL
ncbi:MAG: hypothetical protein IJ343_08735 [Clostridia bacterium]|nr:hypothetical protein [Clostridia bacterium]